MDWFERITGFRELAYEETQAKLSVDEGYLASKHSDRRFAIGVLETPTLAELRAWTGRSSRRGTTKVSCVVGDARQLHADPANRAALFQVASQFNLLEMVGPSVTPEHGVTRYVQDRTQGPACAIAAGAGTIYRNYLMPVGGAQGQRTDRQVDCLADLRQALGWNSDALGQMRNGYALCSSDGLRHIDKLLQEASEEKLDALRGLLRIGLHRNVRVTDSDDERQLVSQAYCSALPVAYSSLPATLWRGFARLVLEAAYEATLLAAAHNASGGDSNLVLLTRLGGGAFGNDPEWIDAAMRRALRLAAHLDLNVHIVCFGHVPAEMHRLCAEN